MFSSHSGSNKGKRRSFFLWGGNTSFTSSPPPTSSNTNAGYNSRTARPTDIKGSPMKGAQDKKLTSSKNPFISSDRVAAGSDRSATESPSTLRSTSRNKSSSTLLARDTPHNGTSSSPSTEGKHEHSSSHISSHDKRKSSSSHRHASSKPSSSHKHKSRSSSKKENKTLSKEALATGSSQGTQQEDPSTLKDRTLSRGRRPPPPVDLSVIRSSMRKVPEETTEVPVSTEKEVGTTSSGTATAFQFLVDQEPPLLTSEKDIKLGESEEASGESNPRQHRRQRSEAEKLVDDLDDFIKEHSEINDSPMSPGKQIEGELDGKIGLQNVLDTDFMDGVDFNSDDDMIDSPLTFIGPLKLPQVAVPPPLPAKELVAPKEPMLESSPAPLLAAAPGPFPVVEVSAASERKSGTSLTGDEQNDRFSFTNSLDEQSVKSIQQVALSETKGAAPIVSNLSCHSSMDFSAYASGTVQLNEKGLDLPPIMNKEYVRTAATEHTSLHTNPFSPKSQLTDMDSGVHVKTTDSDEAASKVFDEDSRVESATTEEQPPRRKFRVVNEDRPTFYMSGLDESLHFSRDKDAYFFDDTATHYSSRSHESGSSKGLSMIGSEKSVAPVNYNNQSMDSTSPSAGMRSAFASLDSVSENDVIKSTVSSTKAKDGFIAAPQISLSNHQSVRSSKSNNSSTTISSGSPKPDKTVRLVSSYVEELRLKYNRTSNFLQAPPNLPVTLKQKNNLIQPKNIKVKIRTSSKQIGIKHGRAKQKLLTLETTEEDVNADGSMKILSNKNKINVDHTREFHNLLNSGGSPSKRAEQEQSPSKSKNDEEEFLNDIPGDDAYDSDDAMAPLREKRHIVDNGVTRNSTVKSYFTKQQEKLQGVNDSSQWNKLPTNINIQDYLDKEPKVRKKSTHSGDSGLDAVYSYGQGLRVANPDSSSD